MKKSKQQRVLTHQKPSRRILSIPKHSSSDFTDQTNHRSLTLKSQNFNKKIIDNFASLLPPLESLVSVLSTSWNITLQTQLQVKGSANNISQALFCAGSSTLFIILKKDTNSGSYSRQFDLSIKGNIKICLKIKVLNHSKNFKYYPGMKLHACFLNSENWFSGPDIVLDQKQESKIQPQTQFQFFLYPEQLEKGIRISLFPPYDFSNLKRLETMFALFYHKIGTTAAGNPIKCYIFGQNNRPTTNVIVIARQHPCQTVSSFVCEELIKTLVSQNKYLENAKWHVIPLANPDGVQHLNSRHNLNGCDINRCWVKHFFPFSSETKYISEYLSQIKLQASDIVIDLHGHSKQLGCFAYCSVKSQEMLQFNNTMSDVCPFFNKQKCCFGVPDEKRNCLRSFVQKFHHITNCITLETSLYGRFSDSTAKIDAFLQEDYKKIAEGVCQSLQVFIQQQNKPKEQVREEAKAIDKVVVQTNLHNKHLKKKMSYIEVDQEKRPSDKRYGRLSKTEADFKASKMSCIESLRNSLNISSTNPKEKERRHIRSIISTAHNRYSSTNQVQYRALKNKVQTESGALRISLKNLTLPDCNKDENAWKSRLKQIDNKYARRRIRNKKKRQDKKKEDSIQSKMERISVSATQIMRITTHH